MLWESLGENIQVETKVDNWEESIKIASKPMIEKKNH